MLGRLLGHPAAPAIAVIPFSLLTMAGFYLLLRFDGTPAQQHYAPSLWPESAGIAFPAGKPALLVFLHPMCPCSRATLDELNGVLSRVPKTALPEIHLLFVRSIRNPDWNGGDLWERASGIPNAIRQWDEGGRIAVRFAARTSGATLLYGVKKDLLFQGGITGSRGHEGDNLGAERLLAALETGRRAANLTQLFGCALAIDHPQEGSR
jgi:hypothetical protein